MNKKILFLILVVFLSTEIIFSGEGVTKRNRTKIFLGFDYQLEFGEYLVEPIKFCGGSLICDFGLKRKFGWKLSILKEYGGWVGDGWVLNFIPRWYVPIKDSDNGLSGIFGLGVEYKIPSRQYYSYNIALQEHIYLKQHQIFGKWKSLVAELGLRVNSSRRLFFETTLIVKPLNFFVIDRTRINGFVSANLSIFYCIRK